jgi:uncharacterized protein YehS (DUF1456 family)
MTNNEIIKKLRIALDLKELDMTEVFKLSGYAMKKSELSSIFRKEGHKNYRECSDLILNHFLNGFIIYKRGHEQYPSAPIITQPKTP